jgi:hypothetical protein
MDGCRANFDKPQGCMESVGFRVRSMSVDLAEDLSMSVSALLGRSGGEASLDEMDCISLSVV